MKIATHLICTIIITYMIGTLLNMPDIYHFMVMATFGSLAPDIDNPHRGIGKWMPKIAQALFTTTHGIGFYKSMIAVWIILLLCTIFGDSHTIFYFGVGYLLHILRELCVPFKKENRPFQNVRLLYPYHLSISIPCFVNERHFRMYHYVVCGIFILYQQRWLEIAPSAW